MSAVAPVESPFQTGGTLQPGRLYVPRPADDELFAALKRGEFCYVLAPRQIGKSSLRRRTAERLEASGVRCASVELTNSGTEEQWYNGLVRRIASDLSLAYDSRGFWSGQKGLAPSERFVVFLSDVVLAQIAGPVAIFIDEIEKTLDLPFRRDDFFATIRGIYNARADRPAFMRLTFCLIGVITPGDLIEDPLLTPFNVGRSIRLGDFEHDQVNVLLPGLRGLGGDPEALLDAIYDWTSGHPYMTLRLCAALEERGGEDTPEAARVQQLVRELFLRRGRTEDPNLAATDDFFTQEKHEKASVPDGDAESERAPWYLRHRTAMLQVYRRLLTDHPEPANGGDPVQMALRLTGIAAERREADGEFLKVRNRIFAHVFDTDWLKEQEAGRLIADALARWESSGKKEDFLLRGQVLQEAQDWADRQADLTLSERQFLDASLALVRREERSEAEAARKRAAEKARAATMLQRLSAVLALFFVVAVTAAVIATQQRQRAQKNAKEAQTNERRAVASERRAVASERRAVASASQAEKAQAVAVARAAEAEAQRQRARTEQQKAEQAAKQERIAKRRAEEQRQIAQRQKAEADRQRREAERQREIADKQRIIVQSGELAVNSLLNPDKDLGVLLAVKAVEATPTPQAQSALRQSLLFGRFTLSGHKSSVYDAQFSPDNKRIVTASEDNTAKVWEASTGKRLSTLSGHEGYVRAARFSPDNKRIVTASDDNTARIYDSIVVDGSPSELLAYARKHYNRPFTPAERAQYLHETAVAPRSRKVKAKAARS